MTTKFAPLITICFLIYSCDSSQKEFEAAQSKNTIEAFETFLSGNPDKRWADSARIQIAFIGTEDDGTLPAYQAFLAQYPISRNTQKTKFKIDSLISFQDYEIAHRQNDGNAYEAFLAQHLEGRWADSARMHLTFFKTISHDSILYYQQFLEKYPTSSYADTIKLLQQKLHNKVFSQSLPGILSLMKSTKSSRKELTQKINELCLTPPSQISYINFVRFQNAIEKTQHLFDQKDTTANKEDSQFLYAFLELSYYVTNAAAKSSLTMMIESIGSGRIANVDVVKIVEGAQLLMEFQYMMALADDNPISRRRAIESLDRISAVNPLRLSRKLTNDEPFRGIDVISGGTPIRLDKFTNTLEKLEKLETDSTNLKLIHKIKARIDTIE